MPRSVLAVALATLLVSASAASVDAAVVRAPDYERARGFAVTPSGVVIGESSAFRARDGRRGRRVVVRRFSTRGTKVLARRTILAPKGVNRGPTVTVHASATHLALLETFRTRTGRTQAELVAGRLGRKLRIQRLDCPKLADAMLDVAGTTAAVMTTCSGGNRYFVSRPAGARPKVSSGARELGLEFRIGGGVGVFERTALAPPGATTLTYRIVALATGKATAGDTFGANLVRVTPAGTIVFSTGPRSSDPKACSHPVQVISEPAPAPRLLGNACELLAADDTNAVVLLPDAAKRLQLAIIPIAGGPPRIISNYTDRSAGPIRDEPQFLDVDIDGDFVAVRRNKCDTRTDVVQLGRLSEPVPFTNHRC